LLGSSKITEDLFQDFCLTFKKIYEKTDLCNNFTSETRVFGNLTLLLLINHYTLPEDQQITPESSEMQIDHKRGLAFSEVIKPFFFKAVQEILNPMLKDLEPFAIKFDKTLEDPTKLVLSFQKGMQKALPKFSLYSKQMNDYLFFSLIRLVDNRILNKLLMCRSRLNMTNAITWTSQLSAIESNLGVELYLSKQVANVIVMRNKSARIQNWPMILRPN